MRGSIALVRLLICSALALPALAQAAQPPGPEHWQRVAQESQARAQGNDQDGLAWFQWGRATLELGAAEEAIPRLLRASEMLTQAPLARAAARFHLARAHARLGQGDAAFDWLQQALRSGFTDLALFESSDDLAALSQDERYEAAHESLRLLREPRADAEFPVALEVLAPPSPFCAHGETVLAYDLDVSSFWPGELDITALDVFTEDSTGEPLAHYEGSELAALFWPGSGGAKKLTLGGRAVAFLWIPLQAGSAVPRGLRHRLLLEGTLFGSLPILRLVDGGAVTVAEPAVVLGAPLAGEGWVAHSSGSWSYHRRGLRAVDGSIVHPQRFAVDWSRYADTAFALGGRPPGSNQEFAGFGADVLAVADAKVAGVRSEFPDNPPFDPPLFPAPGEGFGNFVVLDVGGGRYAAYCHLQANSVRVQAGQWVERGQPIAKVGASGDATSPHLHFHVSTSPSPYRGQGLPYELESFEVLGWEDQSLEVGSQLPVLSSTGLDLRHEQIPIDNVVVRFG